ncbi:phosphoenolpyruvate phosphomutase [Sphingomonas trueperi]|uniref:isocitrate lyase/phosphoenolpyruvate mutase family protein n=1 Tax=Sphingomonas trueperi TaxID=53317 RepID=UPI0033927AEA
MNAIRLTEHSKSLLNLHGASRWIEAHNGLSAHIGSTCRVTDADGSAKCFDAVWVSSLTTSAASLLPDAELHLLDQRLELALQICEASAKSVVLDGDTGGEILAFQYLVRRLERIGAAGVCIEDKRLPKRNSFSGDGHHHLEDPEQFAAKVRAGVAARKPFGPRIIARLESLIAGETIERALYRARLYADAGADAVLIHSIRDSGELFNFIEAARHPETGRLHELPIICVPTAYPQMRDSELFAAGFNVVIYANHLLRASIAAMRDTASRLLADEGPAGCDGDLVAMRDLLALIGGGSAAAPTDDSQPADASESRDLETILAARSQV